MQETWLRSLGWEDPWRKKWQPTPVFLPGESHEQRSLGGYSPQGIEESDMTEHTRIINLTNIDAAPVASQGLSRKLEIQWRQHGWPCPGRVFLLCVFGGPLTQLLCSDVSNVVWCPPPNPQVLTLSLPSQHYLLGFLETSLPSGLPFYTFRPNLEKYEVNFF